MSIVIAHQDRRITGYGKTCMDTAVSEIFTEYLEQKHGTWDVAGVFRQGMKVVIKPNLVHELNFRVRFDGEKMEHPNECFITDWSVIRAVVKYLSVADGLELTILECPLQSCCMEAIVTESMIDELRRMNHKNTVKFVDARRTRYIWGRGREPQVLHNLRDESEYVDFNLGKYSAHSHYEKYAGRFRVTDYPPEEMKKYHGMGLHIYRIAKEAAEADVVISIPKLKTHIKAGMTGAMKNFVGVVGNKECLPHHTKGCPANGGDCYDKRSLLKFLAEAILDYANGFLLTDEKMYYRWRRVVGGLMYIRRLAGLDDELAGSWYGNHTISRTIADLNRIMYYGGKDGKMHRKRQREIISLVDAVVSGQGEGPMKPVPNKTCLLVISDSTAAADIFCAEFTGLDPDKIPYLNEGLLCNGRMPLLEDRERIRFILNGHEISRDMLKRMCPDILVPAGWKGNLEKK